MKTLISCLVFLAILFSTNAQKVINNPAFEFTNSGIYHISKIELSKKETRLHIHSIFIPKWWVLYSQNDCIYLHETGDTLYPTNIIGSEFDKKLWMPASGDSTIVMVYPPISKKVKTIDWFTQDDKQTIFGISLDPNKKQADKDNSIPKEIEDWLQEKLNTQPKQEPMNFTDGDLFKNGDANVFGYIKGFNKLAGFSTGIVYTSNEFTREDYPTAITIHPDGRFETTLKLIHPIVSSLCINNIWIQFYAEPGQTTCLILTWDEFLMADRQRNISYKFKDVEFRGPLAKMNREINNFSPEEWEYKKVSNKISKITPDAYIAFEKEWKRKSFEKLEAYNKQENLSENAYNVLSNDIYLNYGTHLFSYLSTRSYLARTDSTNEILKLPLPENFYEFLNELPLNDPSIVICSEFSTFINRFEYMDPISLRYIINRTINTQGGISIYQFFKNHNVSLNDDEWKMLELASKQNKTDEEKELVKKNKEKINLIYNNNKALHQKRQDFLSAQRTKNEWLVKDSIIDAMVKTNAQYAKDVIKVRHLHSYIKSSDSAVVQARWENTKSLIQNPEVARQGDNLIARMFGSEKDVAYELPAGKGTDIFKGIIDPFKGKVLFIDFWATSCGPCVGGIKSMKATREKYKDNPNFEFIFITDERSSPKATYDTFVAEQGLKNTYRISKDDFYYLRELFKFNGIPRYVLIDANGKVIDDDFSMYNFKTELEKRFPDFVIKEE